MKTISTHQFKFTLKDIHKNTENRKFCFIIGAGASHTSGIPTGGELAHKWFAQLHDILDKSEFNSWVAQHKIDSTDIASFYGIIYRKRFENDKTSGYEFLVQAMKDSKPSLGHIILAQILSRTSGHCVLTTNFDSLIESSVYQFTNKTPLVCGHESLSGYARPSHTHPLIIKIHRDLLLEPKSDPDEINKLALGWKEPLDHIFSTHIPIVIGYGGNDGSLMDYFENMNKPSNFFWCGRDETKISKNIKDLILKHDGNFVKISGFDELLHELLWVFDEIKPIADELKSITDERITTANKQLTKTFNLEKSLSLSDKSKELSAFEYSSIAEQENDFEKKTEIYLEALRKYPTTGWLWWEFTYFLHFTKEDYNNLEEYYTQALEYNKSEGGFLGNYALYLQHIKRDYSNAEHYFLLALELEPENVNILVNYGLFLGIIKEDNLKAEECFNTAISINPNYKYLIGPYTFYLRKIGDYTNAEEQFLRGLSLFPNDSELLVSYAVFLKTAKKDLIQAEEILEKVIKDEPENANALGNYAQILIEKGEIVEAEKLIEKAFQFNKNLMSSLNLELWFYRYAHYPLSFKESESKIEELLEKGVRSIYWDFDSDLEIAKKRHHPNLKKLTDFAKRIRAV